jgi:hypothetical protein
MEPATRIERATCGLLISEYPTSDKLSPQETTNQDASEVGSDGSGLSCPGSSVAQMLTGKAASDGSLSVREGETRPADWLSARPS